MRSRRSHVLLSVVLVASCAAAPPAPVPRDSRDEPELAAAVPESMRGALGFDPPGTGESRGVWEGWRQLFRLRLEDGDRSRTWWVLTGVPAEVEPTERSMTFTMTLDGIEETIGSRLTPVSVWVEEEGEEDLHVSVVELPRPFLEHGAFELCQVFLARPAGDGATAPELTHEEKRMYFVCASSFVALLRVIEGSRDLSDVLWSVVQKPSWLGVLLKGGDVSVSIAPRFEEVVSAPAELPPPLESLPACRFPMSVDVNGTRALDCQLTVCPPGPPLQLSSGIVRLVGTHPERRERRVTLELLGAHGPAAASGTSP